MPIAPENDPDIEYWTERIEKFGCVRYYHEAVYLVWFGNNSMYFSSYENAKHWSDSCKTELRKKEGHGWVIVSN